ncbi:ABC transporter ATP-binding protein [Rubrimonas cliftonensis]|uniref:ATP-binding cassette, subfamily B n=1 Tax=Rubrimonas cliftonensis TaxID=89524 RepID=A0A1H3YUJ3_9RHOB|nr:ABC transporter ATP-binding protein [Rubrimonas cliftonensis]SEA14712.1 ATP-binding cassette, subfamily B [Rubrimonas cliftonensis]
MHDDAHDKREAALQGATPFQRLFAPFERLIDPFGPYAAAEPPRALVPFLRWALTDARPAVVLLGVVSLVLGAAEALVYALIGGLVDRAAAAGPERFFADEWPWLAALGFGVVVAKPLAQLGQNALTSLTFGPTLNQLVIWRLHRHTLGQSMRFFEEDFTGRIAQKQMQTANATTSVTMDTLSTLGMLVSYVATMALLLAAAEPWLALVTLLWALGFGLALRWGVPLVRARSQARAAARAAVTGRLVDSLSHMKTVKLFAHARREEESAKAALARYREAALGFGRAMMAMRVLLNILNVLVTLALIGGALWLWQVGSASIGVVAMAAMLTFRLTNMSNWIAFSALSIFGEIGTIEDGAQTLSPRHDITDRPGARDPAPVTGRVRFEDVTFRYGRETGGVAGLDVDIAAGEKVALVGRSGAGKSTAVSLLLRLYDVEKGRVTLDGADIRDLTQDGLRRAVGTVTQETAIFNRSALANILYGRPEAGLEAAMEAAKRARAHDFIEGLRDGRGRTGYAAHLGERGVKLSGGQRQRIALARAILKDAPVLLLDEATSALDSEVEADIQAALEEVMRDKTVLAIAHRLSTIAAMDRVLVLDQGRVVEQGPHGALLAKGGLYAQLWARQSGGFLGAEAAE